MATLPGPRALLTSLFNTLTTSTSTQTQSQQVPERAHQPYDPPSNPLKALSPAHRALLSTMHVLFTPPMLLQALDILDRGLVVRVVGEALCGSARRDGDIGVGGGGDGDFGRDAAQAEAEEDATTSPLPQLQAATIPLPSRSSPPPVPSPKTTLRASSTLYQVRSSQPPRSRFRDAGGGAGGGNIYTVRLEAWNCSCAAFAFASFPASSSVDPQKAAWDLDRDPDLGRGVDGEADVPLGRERGGVGERGRPEMGHSQRERGAEEWEFGGMSADGKDGGGVPCCKHLLACVLGERWDVLRGYVKERTVGREEMAGIGCEG